MLHLPRSLFLTLYSLTPCHATCYIKAEVSAPQQHPTSIQCSTSVLKYIKCKIWIIHHTCGNLVFLIALGILAFDFPMRYSFFHQFTLHPASDERVEMSSFARMIGCRGWIKDSGEAEDGVRGWEWEGFVWTRWLSVPLPLPVPRLPFPPPLAPPLLPRHLTPSSSKTPNPSTYRSDVYSSPRLISQSTSALSPILKISRTTLPTPNPFRERYNLNLDCWPLSSLSLLSFY